MSNEQYSNINKSPQNIPKISILMPTLNVKDYINQCIESVINQTINDIEIICIDANSTDGTREILEKYAKEDHRIKIITSNEKSYGYQINQALRIATGEYIGIVETDDFISQDMFEILYDNSNNATADIVKSNFYHYSEFSKNSKVPDNDKKNLKNKNIFTIFEEPAFLEGHPSIWAGIYKTSFLKENNIKMVEAKGGAWVDNPFFYETAIKAKSIRYINKPLYYYRETNPNSSSNSFEDFTIPMKRVLEMIDILTENGCNDMAVIEPFYNRLFRYIEIIIEHHNNDSRYLDYITCCYIHKVVKKLDESIVRNKMKFNFQKLYYKFSSPLAMLRFESTAQLTQEELDMIIWENDWLHSTLTDFKQKINELNYENSKLRKN